jgi:O-antigen/teichoic acid export membrane protein
MLKESAIARMGGGSPLEASAHSPSILWRSAGQQLQALRGSASTRASLRNSLYGAGEYVALPLTMLLAAPLLLHRLGLQQYGLWMLATAAVSSTNLVSTGFGDAALKYASMYRGTNDRKRMEASLHVNLAINLVLGGVLALVMWCGSAFAAQRLFKIEQSLQAAAVTAFRIGSLILLVRCVESVLVAALRAHERYGPSVVINVISRAAIVITACVLVSRGYGVAGIMAGTLGIVTASTILQVTAARAVIGPVSLIPAISKAAFSEVFGFGFFSWLQAVAGCVFNQADRLLIGALLGTSAVAYYSVCVQAAQPIHGLIAAGLHFLFPHLSARLSREPAVELRPVVLSIFRMNVAVAVALCLPLALFSKLILRLWMGVAFAQQTWTAFSIVAVSFGFLALNVTAHYALLALGQVKLVATLNLVGGVTMLLAMILLAPQFKLAGAAVGRLLYGPITLLMYWRLHSMLSPRRRAPVEVCPPFAIVEQQRP